MALENPVPNLKMTKAATSLVSSYNEWDPLEEVIIGRAENAQIAHQDKSLFAVEYGECGSIERMPTGRYPENVISQTQEQLETLVEFFEKQGVRVRRPDVFDHSKEFASPDWKTNGQYNYCPRDLFVVAGETIVEAPMTLRARQFETNSFKPILREYLDSGARWIAAPRPLLTDEDYYTEADREIAVSDRDPIFDAANILRVGVDILYLVSDSGNRCGARWLQTALGNEYRVHAIDNIYTGTHVDTTLTLVRPGLVVANALRVNPHNLPSIFKNWDVIYVDEVHDIGFTNIPYASEWIGLNFMMLNPGVAVVDGNQTKLIKELNARGVEVAPMHLTHARTMGGGMHCVTLDVRRTGKLEDYSR